MIYVVGYGNIGNILAEMLYENGEDFVLVRREESLGTSNYSELGMNVFLNRVVKNDIAILATPNFVTEELAPKLLEKGCSTIDAYCAHDKVLMYTKNVEMASKKGNSIAIPCHGFGQFIQMMHPLLFNTFGYQPNRELISKINQEGPHMGTRSVLMNEFPEVKDALCYKVNQEIKNIYIETQVDSEKKLIENISKRFECDSVEKVDDLTKINKKYSMTTCSKVLNCEDETVSIEMKLLGINPVMQATYFFNLLKLLKYLSQKRNRNSRDS